MFGAVKKPHRRAAVFLKSLQCATTGETTNFSKYYRCGSFDIFSGRKMGPNHQLACRVITASIFQWAVDFLISFNTHSFVASVSI